MEVYPSSALQRRCCRGNTTACHARQEASPLKLSFAVQEYVNKLAVMLLEARGNDHSAVQAQIDRLVNECSAICASLAMSNPSAIRTLHCSNFDGALMVQQGPSSSKWLSISVSSVQLNSVMLLQLSRSFIWLIIYLAFPSSTYASCMCISAAYVSAFAVDVCKSNVRLIPYCRSLHSFNCGNVVLCAPEYAIVLHLHV